MPDEVKPESGQPTVKTVERTEDRFLPSDLFESRSRTQPPRNGTGFIREPERDIPVYHEPNRKPPDLAQDAQQA